MKTLALRLRESTRNPKDFGPPLTYLLTPVAMTGYAFALWRLGADLDWTSDFFIADGIFSKWQVWLAIAISTQLAAQRLNGRSSRSGNAADA